MKTRKIPRSRFGPPSGPPKREHDTAPSPVLRLEPSAEIDLDDYAPVLIDAAQLAFVERMHTLYGEKIAMKLTALQAELIARVVAAGHIVITVDSGPSSEHDRMATPST